MWNPQHQFQFHCRSVYKKVDNVWIFILRMRNNWLILFSELKNSKSRMHSYPIIKRVSRITMIQKYLDTLIRFIIDTIQNDMILYKIMKCDANKSPKIKINKNVLNNKQHVCELNESEMKYRSLRHLEKRLFETPLRYVLIWCKALKSCKMVKEPSWSNFRY